MSLFDNLNNSSSLGMLAGMLGGASGGARRQTAMEAMMQQARIQALGAYDPQGYQNALNQYTALMGQAQLSFLKQYEASGTTIVVKPPPTERQKAIDELAKFLGIDLWCQIDRSLLARHDLIWEAL